MHELQGVQTLFNKLEDRLGGMAVYGGKHLGYKDNLKARLGIDSTAFEVLYFDELDEYLETPEDFHLHNDNSKVDWIEVWEQLNKIERELI
ncbi:hypothetical protein HOR18_gp186 [Staphylococcus phage vB_SscM-1]|uniref:Uncharacterized protein n=2 Tax=Sciuriunavirus SscM1 TaxID=2734053 RepID=A0A1X9IA60_9CAUD|nr:hypothetical protein HOR18_gp186 [Staphylococcus phage vB_SscM-1]ANT44849.1 hypothetical protein vB_SscM-1_185 [Staphylococcus phage vB_SscM-1]ANT45051.1 hypothetical protein vB_SscM-2_184 [Staphylococcus phage vB_SscM-2]